MTALRRLLATSGSPTTTSCWRKGQFAVEDITLQVGDGEFIAIVGPSGCGKSTFMKLATGLKHAAQGHDPHRRPRRSTGPLKITGMAFQAPSLLPWRTTLDNVLLPLEIVEPYRSSFKRQARRVREPRRAQLLQSVGLGGYEDKFPWQLSGGMQQRASICRALIHEPKMLLLDEPFGALDAFTREELWCMLRDLWAAQRFNVILVTHDLRESVFLADTVYVMSRSPGRFVVAPRDRPAAAARPRGHLHASAFTDIVHELREHIGAIRQAGCRRSRHEDRARRVEALGALAAAGRDAAALGGASAAASPSPSSSSRARRASPRSLVEFRGTDRRRTPGSTFWVTMVGFGISIVVGVLLGFLIGSSRLAYAAIYPLMIGFNALPKAAFVPILVVWFGIGVGPAVLTAFLISFFPITVNIATGLATLEPELEDVLRVLGAKRWDVLVKVGLPRSMPYFYGSLKVAITLAFVGTTVLAR